MNIFPNNLAHCMFFMQEIELRPLWAYWTAQTGTNSTIIAFSNNTVMICSFKVTKKIDRLLNPMVSMSSTRHKNFQSLVQGIKIIKTKKRSQNGVIAIILYVFQLVRLHAFWLFIVHHKYCASFACHFPLNPVGCILNKPKLLSSKQ